MFFFLRPDFEVGEEVDGLLHVADLENFNPELESQREEEPIHLLLGEKADINQFVIRRPFAVALNDEEGTVEGQHLMHLFVETTVSEGAEEVGGELFALDPETELVADDEDIGTVALGEGRGGAEVADGYWLG